ncbi:MAG TPA: Holliday junction branch migration protein RuvA [Anaeromyxobacteraceae bacterium]|nr:Holliday junction branch migration protein RuvA [Anaeromyxobacteraceae bacterium]
MIARLSGVVLEKGDGFAVIDVHGVGYRVHLSQTSLAALPPRGEPVTVRCFTHVREDALDLFGFASEEEEAVFRELIGVKSVGPRAALNILSGIDARELATAVAHGDVARLTKVPGVGKKTAERLVVELKERLLFLARAASPADEPEAPDVLAQLRNALVGLGYRAPQADEVAEALKDRADGRRLDELLREALKLMR